MDVYCLIGEADPFISMLLARFARACGLQPVQAGVGEDVCALAQQLRPAVIFLDGELPGILRGWEAARRLRSDADLRHIPIVSCSWLNEAGARALITDAIAYLQKPDLHYDDFAAAVLRLTTAPCLAETTRDSNGAPDQQNPMSTGGDSDAR